MKALCLVAHPDDCVIFALSYIHNHPELDWTIGYLTYTQQDPRGAELSAFWQRRGIDTVFLGFEDWWEDDVQKQFTRWSATDAAEACWNLAQTYDLILTHDADGDYGHIHHRLVHDAVVRHYNMVTFAPHNQGTVTLSIPPGTYTLDELPLHGDIIQSFHIAEHKNSYKESA
jgi:LmbE family N-acetylglucosaminyl deacetylase